MDSSVLGVELRCLGCKKLVLICRSCWRNHRYCSTACSEEAERASHRNSQKKYSSSQKGKENRKVGQETRRGRSDKTLLEKQPSNEADDSSKVVEVAVGSAHEFGPECGFCGRRITKVVTFLGFNFSFRSFRC